MNTTAVTYSGLSGVTSSNDVWLACDNGGEPYVSHSKCTEENQEIVY